MPTVFRIIAAMLAGAGAVGLSTLIASANIPDGTVDAAAQAAGVNPLEWVQFLYMVVLPFVFGATIGWKATEVPATDATAAMRMVATFLIVGPVLALLLWG